MRVVNIVAPPSHRVAAAAATSAKCRLLKIAPERSRRASPSQVLMRIV